MSNYIWLHLLPKLKIGMLKQHKNECIMNLYSSSISVYINISNDKHTFGSFVMEKEPRKKVKYTTFDRACFVRFSPVTFNSLVESLWVTC